MNQREGVHLLLLFLWIGVGVLNLIDTDYFDSLPCFMLALYHYRFVIGEFVVKR